MEVIKIKCLKDLLIGSKIIGFGTTAICFLLRNGKVLKLYINTHNKRRLFNRENMLEHLSLLNELKNDYYIVPDGIVMLNDEIIGYTMEYKQAKIVWKMDSFITINEIIEAFKVLEEYTYYISTKKFRLHDAHEKNILFNEYFYVIDLDNGKLIPTYGVDKLHNDNMCSLAYTIVRSIFKTGYCKDIYFHDIRVDEVYKKMLRNDYKAFFELLELLKEYFNDNCKVFDMRINRRKILRLEEHDDYYKRGGF